MTTVDQAYIRIFRWNDSANSEEAKMDDSEKDPKDLKDLSENPEERPIRPKKIARHGGVPLGATTSAQPTIYRLDDPATDLDDPATDQDETDSTVGAPVPLPSLEEIPVEPPSIEPASVTTMDIFSGMEELVPIRSYKPEPEKQTSHGTQDLMDKSQEPSFSTNAPETSGDTKPRENSKAEDVAKYESDAEPGETKETEKARKAEVTEEFGESVKSTQDTEVERPFRPAFQVDRFSWTSGCTRLGLTAGIQLDRLADSLSEGISVGRNVIGLCGSHRGSGSTTLLLCAARRLANRGLNVILVDADVDNPRLAQRLGLLPEAGWEEALHGEQPLSEVAIESIHDRLAILPLRKPMEEPIGKSLEPSRHIECLRKQYDLVLVDLGTVQHDHTASFCVGSRWIDAVVVVHNIRSTFQDDLAATRLIIQEAGVTEIGVAENFV